MTALQVGPDGRTGGTVDKELAERAWQHARRRAEDGSIVLGLVLRITLNTLANVSQFTPHFESINAGTFCF